MKPSVSKLIGLLDKPALLKWANKIGLQGISIDDYKKKSTKSGIDYHLSIENFLKHGLLSDDEQFNIKMQKFFSDKEIIDIEKSIEHDLFVGRFDVKLKWKDIIFICDFKSSSSVYFEQKLQLTAYKMAEGCDHVAVIHIPDFVLRPVTVDENHEKIIYHLSMIYDLKSNL
jgi:hypothetical protein